MEARGVGGAGRREDPGLGGIGPECAAAALQVWRSVSSEGSNTQHVNINRAKVNLPSARERGGRGRRGKAGGGRGGRKGNLALPWPGSRDHAMFANRGCIFVEASHGCTNLTFW